ncbi:MAG: Aspartyl/glutamyl-tRNA(Asn/Gln) amidotransferase subunit C [Berkelbacteria bacterium GW2011_GWB1_38_5]|uniref:Aspartyl/glutamyl-tRNA(Asn/Gln) amidotransferase subunit C n=2 Tax=Candidatus Berkelbacteria TaxID=1618330 RepID=A0A0G0LS35_9BACT|nr:MAG: Aspartyl/glutamyl-tRNA(Asn/Gln) amidotransferase subunit C [Berkelbacteria bacterium GW2011_GWB1_38_5]KKQ90780.1 MAG: Aspartyl/glutamyl-tRNA(Asn/Gln) amidotransferase subunit C [Berkelbacteria bacterium GW2011_GWA1_39_10]
MAHISKQDVEHVAKLSRLKLSDEETAEYTQELGAILDYVDELDSAPTEGVEPISQISGLKNIAREDEVTESLPTEKVLENAPDKKDNFIKVKKIFE